MPNIGYNAGEPIATETPSVSQPKMAQNTNAINQIIAVDHYSFGVDNGGYHKQVTFGLNQTAPALPANTVGETFTNSGTASPSTSQLFFYNGDFTVPISPIKAFGSIQGRSSVGACTIINQSNISSVAWTNIGQYDVVLSVNLGSSAYAIMVTPSYAGGVANVVSGYSITSGTSFTVRFFLGSSGARIDPQFFSFVVLQV